MSILVGGWTNPSEKYWSKWESSPNRGENKTYLNTTNQYVLFSSFLREYPTHRYIYRQVSLRACDRNSALEAEGTTEPRKKERTNTGVA